MCTIWWRPRGVAVSVSFLPSLGITLLCCHTPDDPPLWLVLSSGSYPGSSTSSESDPQPLPSPPRVNGNSRCILSSEWLDMVMDGKGMLGHLQELEIEIGRLVAYTVWSPVQTARAISAFKYSIYFIFCWKKSTWTWISERSVTLLTILAPIAKNHSNRVWCDQWWLLPNRSWKQGGTGNWSRDPR